MAASAPFQQTVSLLEALPQYFSIACVSMPVTVVFIVLLYFMHILNSLLFIFLFVFLPFFYALICHFSNYLFILYVTIKY